MNKRQAKQEAWDNRRTWAELRDFVNANKGVLGQSIVNPSLTKGQSLSILEQAIDEKDKDDVPIGHRYDAFKGRDIMTTDGLIVQNILRECC